MAGSASLLGPLPGMALPMAPLQLLSSVTPAVALSEEDEEMLCTVRYMLDVLQAARTVGTCSTPACLRRCVTLCCVCCAACGWWWPPGRW